MPRFGQPGPPAPDYGQPDYGQQPGQAFPGYPMPGYAAAPPGDPPRTHLVWASIALAGGVLFSLILGFPSGLMALRHARKVRPLWQSGNPAAAVSESRKARTWAIVSTVLDALGVILLTVLIATAGSSASNFHNPSVVAASLKIQLQKRLSEPSSPFYHPGLKVTSVVCTPSGTNTDHCVDYLSNGQTVSEIAVISANGDSYVTG